MLARQIKKADYVAQDLLVSISNYKNIPIFYVPTKLMKPEMPPAKNFTSLVLK